MTAPDPDTIREDTQVRGDVHETIRAALAKLREEEGDQS